jgi:cob(I)alamin adenosyltransferase
MAHRRHEAAGLPRQPQVGGMAHKRHEAAGLHGWSLAQEKISCGDYDLIILDEFTYLLHFGWIDCAAVLDWLRSNKPPNLHLVITGRYAPQELVEAADLVTEMQEIKHPFKQGIKAQAGIEF